jgi:hypothetical protein
MDFRQIYYPVCIVISLIFAGLTILGSCLCSFTALVLTYSSHTLIYAS